MKLSKLIILCYLLNTFFVLNAQKVAVLHYEGGGDWYSNPTALPNLIRFCNSQIRTTIKEIPETVKPNSTDIFQYPFLHMTGHGNVFFSEEDVLNLRTYLESGGFLHIDDNYGMAPYVTNELTKVFPEIELKELPANHALFSTAFPFPKGLPKIHEHDGKRPRALGIFLQERLVVLLTLESDLGDGWEDAEVHNDPDDVRKVALQMGANIIKYAFER